MVAVGQALMSRPNYLLLDEPTAGLAPALIAELYDKLGALAKTGLGFSSWIRASSASSRAPIAIT